MGMFTKENDSIWQLLVNVRVYSNLEVWLWCKAQATVGGGTYEVKST